MRRVLSPEICLRYQHGVSDLVDPYFQTLALRQRLSGRDTQGMKTKIGLWAMMLTTYNTIALTTAAIFWFPSVAHFTPAGPIADICLSDRFYAAHTGIVCSCKSDDSSDQI